MAYIKKFCPKRFNQYCYFPSLGSSGGLITIWNGSLFSGITISANKYHVTVELTCKISANVWYLTNIYGPAHHEDKQDFFDWLLSIDNTPMHNWIILGDFNLIRSTGNRNWGTGDINHMLMFNSIIAQLDLEDIPIKGRAYTWSNMQDDPLLVKLDWIFTSGNWTNCFPNTVVSPLSKLSSDHIPIKIQIGTYIPKSKIFRFEEY